MKKLALVILSYIILYNVAICQVFTGDGIAIHKDSIIIKAWAISAETKRGYINISDTTLTYTEQGITSNKAFSGSVENTMGKADGLFLSLGDGGYVTLIFEKPITNGPGPDFAVYENMIFSPPTQIQMAFVELAFVEVSSDGINFERFPAISNQAFEQQVATYDAVDRTLFKNLAGCYPVFYGTPFDLDDIEGNIVDKSNITHVRIIDVVGNINPEFATYDSRGNIINEAWPTPFATCGFDLDAVAVIHQLLDVDIVESDNIKVFPNPTKDYINIISDDLKNVKVYDLSGRELVCKRDFINTNQFEISGINSGVYVLVIETSNKLYSKKIVVSE